jgi:ribonuclease HII
MSPFDLFYTNENEAGCDEAGRGCLAGPVFAAAVILGPGFLLPNLNDSKKLSSKQRDKLRFLIEKNAVAWAVGIVSSEEIDEINILNASFLAMHRAIDTLMVVPKHLLIDGNRFKIYKDISHTCHIGGDAKYAAIAAASILAKTHRDEYMTKLHDSFPDYDWNKNMGYPTLKHRKAIYEYGLTAFHRKTFKWQFDPINPTLF